MIYNYEDEYIVEKIIESIWLNKQIPEEEIDKYSNWIKNIYEENQSLKKKLKLKNEHINWRPNSEQLTWVQEKYKDAAEMDSNCYDPQHQCDVIGSLYEDLLALSY